MIGATVLTDTLTGTQGDGLTQPLIDPEAVISSFNKLRGLSPRANYTDKATAACQ
jgi:hypothetical protein